MKDIECEKLALETTKQVYEEEKNVVKLHQSKI